MGRAGLTGLIAAAALLAACGHDRDAHGAPHGEREHTSARATRSVGDVVPFKLTKNRGDFLFEWPDARGEFSTATKLDDVPEQFRAKVRVEPLSLPPDRRAPPDRVYLADLRRAGRDGVYPVTVIPREDFEALAGVLSSPLPPPPAAVSPGAPHPDPLPRGERGPDGGVARGERGPDGGVARGERGADGGVARGEARVTIYGASWCGPCHQAAAWLRAHGVPFVEKDIERDPGARAEMEQRCRAAGVQPGSIPIIAVGGRIAQGFSPGSLQRLLAP